MTTWWEATGLQTFDTGSTVTGTVDGRTWTITGGDITGVGAMSLRSELANAFADQLTEEWGVAVSPYRPKKASGPHIWFEPDQPFYDPTSFGANVWAYKAVIVVPGRHQAAWDWFERVAPYLFTATNTIAGGMFHELDAPTDLGDDDKYLTAEAHITIKRARS